MRSRSWMFIALAATAASACGGGSEPQLQSNGSPLCAADPAPAPLRRLTRFEYGRTLSALTGVPATVAAELPPDEETLGFDDIAAAYSVSTLHAARYLDVAEGAAAALIGDAARRAAVAGCDPLTGDAACVAAFIDAFGAQAWRRPLTDGERQAMAALHAETADPGPGDGLSAVVATMLQAPQLLYRPEAPPAGDALATLDDPLATRLAFMLTGAGPDPTLAAAATAGRLDTEAGLLAETDRLLGDGRARELFGHFATQWWEIDNVAQLDKDRRLYRAWTDEIPAALAEESRLFLDEVWRAGPTVAALLTAPFTYADATLATFYGLPAPAGAGWERVARDPAQGGGMLAQGAFLAAHAKADQTSPVLRGKFVLTQLLCAPPPPPPPDIVVMPPTVDPRLSTRQRFAQHTASETCAQCHRFMDPLGFAFEHFDAAGRWRVVDGGQPVDASGTLVGSDVDGPIDGVGSLGNRLAGSDQVEACMATQWFRYAFGRAEQSAGDRCAIGELAGALGGPNGNFKKMVRATVRLAAFRTRGLEAQPQ